MTKPPKIKRCPACDGEYVYGGLAKVNGRWRRVCGWCDRRLNKDFEKLAAKAVTIKEKGE
jgi:hypothetical protein